MAAHGQTKVLNKKRTAIREKYKKKEILKTISENTGLTKDDVSSVFEELSDLIERHIKKRSAKEFILTGFFKIEAIKQPAKPARKGGPNPFKAGEFFDVAKKPATSSVKITALKKLKDYAL